jgi:hypothetical protein
VNGSGAKVTAPPPNPVVILLDPLYLLLTASPAVPYSLAAFLATSVRDTGIGRAPRFSWRDGRLLVESAPGVVAELADRIERITTAVDGRPVSAVSSVDHLTAEAGRAVIAENYAAYVAEYGEPAESTPPQA